MSKPTGNPNGRPPKFKDALTMEKAIAEYFARCQERERPPTMAGMALELDMSRNCLCEYAKKDDFSDIIIRWRQEIEIHLEERLDGAAPTGTIFNLKNNFGWKDKTELNHSGKIVTGIVRTVVDP